MIPATFTITMLLVMIVLAAAGAPLLVLYIVGGLAAFWQLMVTLAAGSMDPAVLEDSEELPESDSEYTRSM